LGERERESAGVVLCCAGFIFERCTATRSSRHSFARGGERFPSPRRAHEARRRRLGFRVRENNNIKKSWHTFDLQHGGHAVFSFPEAEGSARGEVVASHLAGWCSLRLKGHVLCALWRRVGIYMTWLCDYSRFVCFSFRRSTSPALLSFFDSSASPHPPPPNAANLQLPHRTDHVPPLDDEQQAFAL
jgi:hypothetical protein